MSHEHRAYGWKTAEMGSSHAYLLPAVRGLLRSMHGGRRVRLVDLGCGNGYVTAELAQGGHDVIGVDASPDGIEIAKKAYPDARFEVASVYDDDLASVVGEGVDGVVS